MGRGETGGHGWLGAKRHEQGSVALAAGAYRDVRDRDASAKPPDAMGQMPPDVSGFRAAFVSGKEGEPLAKGAYQDIGDRDASATPPEAKGFPRRDFLFRQGAQAGGDGSVSKYT